MSRNIKPHNRLYAVQPLVDAHTSNSALTDDLKGLTHTGKRGRPATTAKGFRILRVLQKHNAKDAIAAFEAQMATPSDAKAPTQPDAKAPKKRGRPVGSKNKAPAKRGRPAKAAKRGRPAKAAKVIRKSGPVLEISKVITTVACEPNLVDGLKALTRTGKRGRPATTIQVAKVRKFLAKNKASIASKEFEALAASSAQA